MQVCLECACASMHLTARDTICPSNSQCTSMFMVAVAQFVGICWVPNKCILLAKGSWRSCEHCFVALPLMHTGSYMSLAHTHWLIHTGSYMSEGTLAHTCHWLIHVTGSYMSEGTLAHTHWLIHVRGHTGSYMSLAHTCQRAHWLIHTGSYMSEGTLAHTHWLIHVRGHTGSYMSLAHTCQRAHWLIHTGSYMSLAHTC